MQNSPNTELHFWMTRSVARAMGVNLSDAMMCEKISATEYAQLVARCRGCNQIERCQSWLASAQSVTCTAPSGCKNAHALEWLARQH